MAYNNLMTRTNVAPTIPEQVSNAIMTSVRYESALLRLSRRVPISTNQTRLPVLSTLPYAYFVQGDTGQKQTTEMAWANKYINVEELAVIVPIPQNVFDDMTFNIWDEAQPLLVQAIGRTVDNAAFFGVNKPASWPTDFAAGSVAASHTVARGTNNAAAGGIAGDIDDTIALVEASGFAPDGMVTNLTYKTRLRKARDTTGQRILDFGQAANGQEPPLTTIEGIPLHYNLAGMWPTGSAAAELFIGDWTQSLVGVRKDITVDMFKEGVIQDNTGAIVYNLLQQDMVALRVTFRMGWQVANTINYQQPTEALRYPWAMLVAP